MMLILLVAVAWLLAALACSGCFVAADGRVCSVFQRMC